MNTVKPPSPPERWHLSKSVSITLIVGMALQFVVGVWMARGALSEIHEEINYTRLEGQESKRRIEALEQARSTEKVSERLAVVESRVANTEAATLRIESDVKTLVRRSGP